MPNKLRIDCSTARNDLVVLTSSHESNGSAVEILTVVLDATFNNSDARPLECSISSSLANLAEATIVATGFISYPKTWQPNWSAIELVVPEPFQGSRIFHPGLDPNPNNVSLTKEGA
ncbi:hypothetical protein D3C71_1888700 [compost metagenome]